MKNKGFTILEMILYVGISAIVLILIMTITWDIMKNQKQTRIKQEMMYSVHTLMQKITTDIQEADDLNEGFSIFNDPGSLSLQKGVNEILIESYLKQMNIDGVNITIRKLRRTEGGQTSDLSKDNMSISSFALTDLSRDQNSHNINVFLEIQYIGTAGESLGVSPVSLERSISIRNK